MSEAKAYSIPETVLFCIFANSGMSPNKGKPLLIKLRKALEEFKLDHGEVIGNISVVDELECWQKNSNLALGSYKIRLEIVDHNRDGNAGERWNNKIPQWIGQDLGRIYFSHYDGLIKVVQDHRDLGDLSIPDTPMVSDDEAKKVFYGRFSKSIFDFPFLARLLVLDKEAKRVTADKTVSPKLKEKLLKDLDRRVTDCKRNMKKKEMVEYEYFSTSMGLIPNLEINS